MKLELQSYNLADAEQALLSKCLDENPDKRLTDIAQMLGISERSLYRKIQGTKYGRRFNMLERAISIVEKSGYKVTRL